MKRRVGLLIFDGVEVLDACGPFEVFSIAERDGEAIYEVCVVAEEQRIVQSTGGLKIEPHATIANHPPLDMIVVPGGEGTRREELNPRSLEWIAQQAESVELVTSVCTGAFLLAKCGLLEGREATTHWAVVEKMQAEFPHVSVRGDQRIVDQGRIITSAGVSAGIDMALTVVERQHGREVAMRTARDMEYDWRP